MSDQPQSYKDISALYNERRKTRDVAIAAMNEVEAAIIHGELPVDYNRLFTEKDVKIELRTLRAADDGLTKFLSEIPVLPRVDTLGKRDSDTAKNRAELVEKIAYGWHNGSAMRGGTEFDGIAFQLATHQVRFADACVVVQPDYKRQLVYLEAKDPRCLFAPKGWHPWSPVPMDGALLVYECTLGEVKQRFAYDAYGMTKPDVMARLNNAYKPTYGYGGDYEPDDAQIVQVGIYRSREKWLIVCLNENDIVLSESETGDPFHPGVCGVMSFKQFDRGPLFTGQVGIEAGLMKVANQIIQNTERVNKATRFGPPVVGDKVVAGEYNVINQSLLQGRPAQFYRDAPDTPTHLTQVLASFLQMSQMFNYNPDSNMGQGDANSGKAIQQLQAGPRSLVTNILFSPYKPAFPRIYDDCLDIELNLWPNERKTVVGYRGRERFEVDYTPSAALQGFKGHIKIEEPRMGGYNAFLEAVQKKDAGMASLRDVLERDPDVRDVEQTIRRIESESVDTFVNAAFEALGGVDPLTAIKASAEIKRQIDQGKTKFEAIQEVINSGMLEPPQPQPDMAQLPPELTGGMPEASPMDSLTGARGF